MSETQDLITTLAGFAAVALLIVAVCLVMAAIPAARGLSDLYDKLTD